MDLSLFLSRLLYDLAYRQGAHSAWRGTVSLLYNCCVIICQRL